MRAKLLGALAERDHYLAVLKQHGIDPGPVPAHARAESAAASAPVGAASAESPAAVDAASAPAEAVLASPPTEPPAE
jgi:hypothetical protein